MKSIQVGHYYRVLYATEELRCFVAKIYCGRKLKGGLLDSVLLRYSYLHY